MVAAKAVVGLAVPLLTALLIGFSSGSFNFEEIGMLVGALVTGLLVYFIPNQPDVRSTGSNVRH